MHFRKASTDDLESMQALARRTIDFSYRAFIDDESVDWFLSGPSDEYVSKNMENSTLLTVDGSIVGLAACKENLIDLIMIDHKLHGRGLGSALLAHCESKLFERYESIRLESFEGNGRANRFYRGRAWIRTGIEPDTMSGGRKWIFEKTRASGRIDDRDTA